MQDWLRALDLRDIILICQDWGGLIGMRLVAEEPDRFARVVTTNTTLPTGDTKTDTRLQGPATYHLARRRPLYPGGLW